MEKLLEEIGLTKSEIKVYLALLELGSTTTGKIVDKSKASSSKIYEILDKLIQKGLASYIIKSGTKHFEAAEPKRILDYVEEKKKRLNQQEEKIKQLVPELELKQKLSEYKSEATILKGIEGVKTAFNDVLKTMKRGEEYHVLVGMESMSPLAEFIKHYHHKRSKLGIKVKLLYSPDSISWAKQIEHLPHTIIKISPNQILTYSFILMYKNKTFITVSKGKEITVFKFNSKQLTDSFRTTFNLLWNQETQVLKGLDAVQNLFEEMLEHKHGDLIGAKGYFLDKRPKYADKWEKLAKKKGFTMRNIVDPETKSHRITKFSFAKTKYTIPKEFTHLSVYWIFGDKVAISNWMGDEPIVLVIENKRLHQMYKKQFELMWKKKIV